MIFIIIACKTSRHCGYKGKNSRITNLLTYYFTIGKYSIIISIYFKKKHTVLELVGKVGKIS